MNLSTAQDIKIGSTSMSAVYLGSTLVWSPYYNDYLTIEAITPGTVTIKYDPDNGSAKTISYSTDNGTTWKSKTTTSSAISLKTLAIGEKILFKGTNSRYFAGLVFGGTAQTKVYGNIMSLLYGDNFVGQATLTDSWTFLNLFYAYTNLISAENLILPATMLAEYCYMGMFAFCTSLTTAPKLPATTLASSCYDIMFSGCTSLTKAPELPATTLAGHCYSNMFEGCTSLSNITCHATDISATGCTYKWVENVSSSGTFTKASSMQNWTTGDSGIPSNWTVLNAS